MPIRPWLRVLACAAGVSTAAGCLDHTLPPDEAAHETFIALQRDFAGFDRWMVFPLGEGEHPGASTPAERFAYLNRLPPIGAESFPVGTIIVKTVEAGSPEEWTVHAMVKRGGGYNAGGAYGWEWFDLALSAEGVPVILWRGEGPPSGHGYGALVDGVTEVQECNSCHDPADNDSVLSAPLDLDQLP